MKPDPDRFLQVAAAHLLGRTAPALGAGYEQSSVALLAGLLASLAEEYDRAAARRVAENRALRALFRRAVPVARDPRLRARLEAAAGTEDADLAVSALERSNADLRALLIDLHAHAESVDTPDARALDTELWRELVASTGRRALTRGPF